MHQGQLGVQYLPQGHFGIHTREPGEVWCKIKATFKYKYINFFPKITKWKTEITDHRAASLPINRDLLFSSLGLHWNTFTEIYVHIFLISSDGYPSAEQRGGHMPQAIKTTNTIRAYITEYITEPSRQTHTYTHTREAECNYSAPHQQSTCCQTREIKNK